MEMCSMSNDSHSSPNALSINSFKSRVWPLVRIKLPIRLNQTVTVNAVLSKRVISIEWLQKMGLEPFFACFKIPSRNLPRRTEKYYKTLSSVTASALREIQYVYRQVVVRPFSWKIWNHFHCLKRSNLKLQFTSLHITLYFFTQSQK